MTLEIRKANGELSADDKASFQRFFRGLPDGCYLLACFDCGSAAGQIEALAAWYNGVSETDSHDPAFLDSLIARSNNLAYYLLRLSQELGELYKDRAASELARKRGYFAALSRLRKEARAGKEKFVFSAAEIEAETEIADLRASEVLADSLWMQTRLLYEAGRDILQRMSQQISNLKSYRDAYLRSDNSNQNFPQ